MTAQNEELDVVWESMLDDRYRVSVARIDDYNGTFEVYDQAQEKTLASEKVPLAYGAMFGPDVADVAAWQEKALAVVDG